MDASTGDPICPLCGRPIPPEARQSLHHLIPRMKGGTHGPTVRVHQICHNEVHALLTEAELARHWYTPARLRAHPQLSRVWAWLRRKPPTFHARSRRNIRLRGGR